MEVTMTTTTNPDGELRTILALLMFKAVAVVFTELVDGAASGAGWVLNRGDEGLLKSLDRLSCRDASAVAPGGEASIAAHVDHLCYGLSLLNRWSEGEKNAFADADYRASWRRIAVSKAEWKSLRDRLRQETSRWQDTLTRPRAVDEIEMNGIVASAAHLAYHLGAIRQTRSTVRHAVHRRTTDFLPMGSRGDQSWTGAVLFSEDAGR
jgi:hypothetical protein